MEPVEKVRDLLLLERHQSKSDFTLSIQLKYDRWRHASLNTSKGQGLKDSISAVRNSLCMPSRSCPLPAPKEVRARLELEYGPHWFVKMPWKCQMVELFYVWASDDVTAKEKVEWAWFRGKWRRSVGVMKEMDGDGDGVVSVEELDSYVESDGIDVIEYRRQVRCRH